MTETLSYIFFINQIPLLEILIYLINNPLMTIYVHYKLNQIHIFLNPFSIQNILTNQIDYTTRKKKNSLKWLNNFFEN